MCFYFDILYGLIFTNNRSRSKDKTKKQAKNIGSQQIETQKTSKAKKATYGTNLSAQFERNLIESFESSNNSLIVNVGHFKKSPSEASGAKQRQKQQQQQEDWKNMEKQTSSGEVSSSSQDGDGIEERVSSESTETKLSDNQQQQQSFAMESSAISTTTSTHSTPNLNSAEFKIRTSNRRHVDFDDEFDLNDVDAPNRSKWSGPFHFIQAADSQFGMIDSYTHKRTEPGWKEEIQLCETLVATCNQMEPKPKFMIICGDLADAWPNTETRRQQVVDFKRIFAKLDNKIPLVCVCGNHDVGDEPTLASVQDYKRNFGDDYFYFTMNDVLFIVINSQFYQHREFVQDYAKNQDQWLEGMLAKCKLFKYSIVFEHIPWFLEHFDEEDDYFNIKKEVRLQWLRKFKDAGVTKIMCGHYHRNAGGWYENMELVVTSAIGAQCGNDKSGVRIVKVLEESIEHQYYAMQDIPQKIQLSS